jgi:hypothetical protein
MEKQTDKSYSIETEEFIQDDIQFIITNRKPVEADTQSVKEELYKIFLKYA